MKKYLIKFLSLVLALCMVPGTTAFAASIPESEINQEQMQKEVQNLVQIRLNQVAHNFEGKDSGYLEAYTNYLIDYYGEQQLHQQLREHVKNHCWEMDQDSLTQYALGLHASRLFDDPLWVDFIKFNKAYRPEVLESTRLIWIETECCKGPGEIPYIRFMEDQSEGMTCCPHCGRWSGFQPIQTSKLNGKEVQL